MHHEHDSIRLRSCLLCNTLWLVDDHGLLHHYLLQHYYRMLCDGDNSNVRDDGRMPHAPTVHILVDSFR